MNEPRPRGLDEVRMKHARMRQEPFDRGPVDAASGMKTRGIMRWRTVGLLLAMLIIVGLPYVVTLQGARDTEQATEWVVRSTEVKSIAYRIAYVVHDSEAATYRLLAGDVLFSEALFTHQLRLEGTLAAVSTMIGASMREAFDD